MVGFSAGSLAPLQYGSLALLQRRFACAASARFLWVASARFACVASARFACAASARFACAASARFACVASVRFACAASVRFLWAATARFLGTATAPVSLGCISNSAAGWRLVHGSFPSLYKPNPSALPEQARRQSRLVAGASTAFGIIKRKRIQTRRLGVKLYHLS